MYIGEGLGGAHEKRPTLRDMVNDLSMYYHMVTDWIKPNIRIDSKLGHVGRLLDDIEVRAVWVEPPMEISDSEIEEGNDVFIQPVTRLIIY